MKNNSDFQGFNILRIRPIRSVVLWPGFPYIFQALMLAVFISLAVIGWGHFAPEGVNDKLYAKTNIVNLMVWGLWWPSMVWGLYYLAVFGAWYVRLSLLPMEPNGWREGLESNNLFLASGYGRVR